MRLIWSGITSLVSLAAALSALGVTTDAIDGPERGVEIALLAVFALLLAALSILIGWSAWRLSRTSIPLWIALQVPLGIGLAVFSGLVAMLAMVAVLDASEQGGVLASLLIATLPLSVLATIAGWGSYRLGTTHQPSWQTVRTPALLGIALASSTLILWGTVVAVDVYRSPMDTGLEVLGIYFVTVPSYIAGSVGIAIVLMLRRVRSIKAEFGKWITSSVLALFFFLAAIAATVWELPGLVPLGLVALSAISVLKALTYDTASRDQSG